GLGIILYRKIIVAEPALRESPAGIYFGIFGIKCLSLVEILNRLSELAKAAIGFTALIKGFGRFRRVLDDLIIVFYGALILLLSEVSIAAVEEGIGKFGILSQGFVKALNGVVVLPQFVIGESAVVVGLGEVSIAAQRLVIIFDRGRVLVRFVMCIAPLEVSVG